MGQVYESILNKQSSLQILINTLNLSLCVIGFIFIYHSKKAQEGEVHVVHIGIEVIFILFNLFVAWVFWAKKWVVDRSDLSLNPNQVISEKIILLIFVILSIMCIALIFVF